METFVETGTYLGDTPYALMNVFQEIYTIEINSRLHEWSRIRFSGNEHVHLLLGDSAVKLPVVLERLDCPALFWLDGHYSGGITGKGSQDTPILHELDSIFGHPVCGHVILIDDARYFTGRNGYPTLQELDEYVSGQEPGYRCEIANDIIRITAD